MATAVAPHESVQPQSKPSPEQPCRRCDHPLSDHCKSNVQHGYHKEDMWPANQRTRTTTCHTRHCNQPICSCIDFLEQETR